MEHQSGPRIHLFAYGSLREGERDHGLLQPAQRLGIVTTAPRYRLVDLGVYPALIARGTFSVVGELYAIDRELRRQLDVLKECPILFQRESIELATGDWAEAYVMREDQVPGRRRLHVADWKQRFAPRSTPQMRRLRMR